MVRSRAWVTVHALLGIGKGLNHSVVNAPGDEIEQRIAGCCVELLRCALASRLPCRSVVTVSS